MAQDAPPGRVFPPLIDPLAHQSGESRPRLVPLNGPRRQSVSITVELRSLTVLLSLPAVALAVTDSAIRTTLSAQVVHWYASSLLFLCALGVLVISLRPPREDRRYLLGVIALVVLSLFEAAPRENWHRVAPWLETLHRHAFSTLVMGATICCSVLAIESRRRERVIFAPAVIVYVVGAVAGFLIGHHEPEHPLSSVLRSVSALGRMLGPALAVRAMLQYLSPPERPAALRFVFTPTQDAARQTRTSG